MSHEFSYFPFHVKDWLTDHVVVVMTPEERGGYIQLICHAWLADVPGYLPNNNRALAELSGLRERWPECRAAILAAFSIIDDEWITQKRIVREFENVAGRANRATKAASQRWKKPKRRAAKTPAIESDQQPQSNGEKCPAEIAKFKLRAGALIGREGDARLPADSPQALADHKCIEQWCEQFIDHSAADIDRASALARDASARMRPMAWLTSRLKQEKLI